MTATVEKATIHKRYGLNGHPAGVFPVETVHLPGIQQWRSTIDFFSPIRQGGNSATSGIRGMMGGHVASIEDLHPAVDIGTSRTRLDVANSFRLPFRLLVWKLLVLLKKKILVSNQMD
jgi:hypothetical protein